MGNESTPSTPLRVCSYPRSGTHLLMALLWANYDVGECGEKIKAPNLRFQIDGNIESDPFIRWAQLFGTHKHVIDLPEFSIEPGQVVYLIRDPRDVFRSLWFMRFGNLLPENYVNEKRLCGWRNHVQEYHDLGAIIIRYEDLVRDWQSAISPIVYKFNLVKKIASGGTPCFGPREIGQVGWMGPVGPTAAAPHFPKEVDDRFAEILGDEIFDYKLGGLEIAE